MGRLERDATRLAALEAEYEGQLKSALVECAAGRWGLFGQNAGLGAESRWRPPALDELYELAERIAELRGRLRWEPYPLHTRFESLRGRADENAPGEPRIAQQLLVELSWAPAA